MTVRLLTASDLAARLGVSERKVLDWRRTYGWPATRFGRTFRWTEDQYAEILSLHISQPAAAPDRPSRLAAAQTPRSAARRRSAT